MITFLYWSHVVIELKKNHNTDLERFTVKHGYIEYASNKFTSTAMLILYPY